ncbi:MAG: SDR family oxidoreductase [Gammaproteobacteria bacterium]|nr:SDR family oxidoreductase [Gammaproteobacteria bacterium]
MEFSKVIAVVTGGASGLGYASAQKIVAAGGRVALLDVNEEVGEAAARTLGDSAIFIRTDVSNEGQVNAAVEKAHKHFGGLTLAVNCAGVIGAGRVLGREAPMDGSFFARTIQINLIGSFFVAKAAANLMQHNTPNADGERGVIISTASIAAFEGQIGQAAYSASKGGVVAMALPMAREFARLGIRVNTIAPGIFMTPMMSGMPEDVQQSLAAQVPFPSRLGRPEEYADTVKFIYEMAMLNAEVIRLDGAIRMQPK